MRACSGDYSFYTNNEISFFALCVRSHMLGDGMQRRSDITVMLLTHKDKNDEHTYDEYPKLTI